MRDTPQEPGSRSAQRLQPLARLRRGRPAADYTSGARSRRMLVATVVALLLAVSLVPWIGFVRDFIGPRNWISGDFPAFHAAARLIASGAGSQIYNLEAITAAQRALAGHAVGDTGILPYFNPPFFAWALSPAAELSLQAAYRWWSVFSLGWLVLNVWLLWRISAPLNREARVTVIAGYLALFSVTYGLRLGQYSLILQASWSSAFLLLRGGRPALAGLALSPLLIKPELLVPVTLFMLWRRQWSTLIPLGAVALAGVLASLLASGPATLISYPAFLLDSTTWVSQGNTPAAMFGWNGILAVSTPATAALRSALALVLGLLTLGLAGYIWGRRTPPGRAALARQWLALSIATMLADPHFYYQDTVLLVPGVVALLAATEPPERNWVAAGAGAAWLVLQLALYSNEAWNINVFGIAAVLGLVWLVITERRSGRWTHQAGGGHDFAPS